MRFRLALRRLGPATRRYLYVVISGLPITGDSVNTGSHKKLSREKRYALWGINLGRIRDARGACDASPFSSVVTGLDFYLPGKLD